MRARTDYETSRCNTEHNRTTTPTSVLGACVYRQESERRRPRVLLAFWVLSYLNYSFKSSSSSSSSCWPFFFLLFFCSVCECVFSQLLRLLELPGNWPQNSQLLKSPIRSLCLFADLRKLGLERRRTYSCSHCCTHTCPSLRQPPTRHPNEGPSDKIFVWMFRIEKATDRIATLKTQKYRATN